jgi:hypothetical protein
MYFMYVEHIYSTAWISKHHNYITQNIQLNVNYMPLNFIRDVMMPAHMNTFIDYYKKYLTLFITIIPPFCRRLVSLARFFFEIATSFQKYKPFSYLHAY